MLVVEFSTTDIKEEALNKSMIFGYIKEVIIGGDDLFYDSDNDSFHVFDIDGEEDIPNHLVKVELGDIRKSIEKSMARKKDVTIVGYRHNNDHFSFKIK